jgi:hypothetical protein
MLLTCCRIGLMTAVKAAAPMKKINRPTNTHAIPLIFLRDFFLTAGADTAPDPNRTVASTSADPLPSRNPQLRQKRSSDGIEEWQLEQVVRSDVAFTGKGISGFWDIINTCSGMLSEICSIFLYAK